MTPADIDTFAAALLDGAPCVETIESVALRASPIHGRGLFATHARERGDILCILDGQLVDITRYPSVIDAMEWNALSPERLLVHPLRTSHGFINHSLRPNVSIDGDGITMRSCAAIARGEELTLDYVAQPVPDAYRAGSEAAALRQSE